MIQGLGFLQEFINKVRKYSNGWGKVWWLLNMLFRGFVVVTIGSAVYGDEYSSFNCDTNQPGCSQVCFNRFTPMNPIRFWSFQLVFVFLPTIFFYAYANRFNAKIELIEQLKHEIDNLISPENSIREYTPAENEELRKREFQVSLKRRKLDKTIKQVGNYKRKTKFDVLDGEASDQIVSSKMKSMYIFHCLVKILVECVFLYLNYILQAQQSQVYDFGYLYWGDTWYVPERYLCKTEGTLACNQQLEAVTCWVSRPKEKTYLLHYMVCLTYDLRRDFRTDL